MFTKFELLDAIDELSQGKHSVQNCEKLAAVYTVLDHLYPDDLKETEFSKGYSMDNGVEKVKDYGSSRFLQAIAGKDSDAMWMFMDELMTALQVLNPKLYDSVLSKLE